MERKDKRGGGRDPKGKGSNRTTLKCNMNPQQGQSRPSVGGSRGQSKKSLPESKRQRERERQKKKKRRRGRQNAMR